MLEAEGGFVLWSIPGDGMAAERGLHGADVGHEHQGVPRKLSVNGASTCPPPPSCPLHFIWRPAGGRLKGPGPSLFTRVSIQTLFLPALPLGLKQRAARNASSRPSVFSSTSSLPLCVPLPIDRTSHAFSTRGV